MIRLDRVSKQYPGALTPALQNVSLTLRQGEITGIVGRSGAGKSTLIRCLNLLERPDSGRILFDEQDITLLTPGDLRRQRQRSSMIFQHFNLLHSRNVADNVAVPLEIAGMPRGQRLTRVAELLDLVGLNEKARAFPSQLSGGQQQRVGIARALAARPDYLLCDEATSALDAETTQSVLALLKQINQQFGLTIVMITHQLEVVKAVCDRAALLEKGRLVEEGALRDLLMDPRSALRDSLLQGGHDEQAFLRRHGLTFGQEQVWTTREARYAY